MTADIRFALRQLRRSPGFTAAAVLTLALGIGACTAAYSLARGLLWRPLPFEQAERIVVLEGQNPSRGISSTEISYADLRDFRERSRQVTGLAAMSQRQATLGAADGADRITGWIAEPELFTVLGTPAMLGRTFRADEARADAPPVVLLSYRFWAQRFAADSDIVGRTVTINGVAHTVVGVMPASFQFVRGNIFLPLVPWLDESRGERGVIAIGRLVPGASLEGARAELVSAAAALESEYPATNRGWSVEVNAYRDAVVDADSRRSLMLMLSAVAVVLLIACTNVAGLLMARGAGRARELAVRAAIGASRSRLIRQSLTESALLAVMGAVLGLGIASWSNDLLLATLPMEDLPVWFDQSLDVNALVVTGAVALASVFLVGLLPALRASRPAVVDTLKGSASGVAGTRARSALVVAQVGMAVVLLSAAALFSQSFLAIRRANLGFDDRGMVTAHVFFGAVFRGGRVAWMRDALDRLRGMPGVTAAALTGAVPGDDGGEHRALAVDGQQVAPGDEPIVVMVPSSDGFLDALGTRPLSGRWFTGAEAADREARVAVVGAGLARRLWPDGNAIGRRLRLVPDTTWLSVVGVVPDFQYEEFGEDGAADRLQIHIPFALAPWRSPALLVRGSVDPASLVEPLRRTIRAVHSDVPVFDVMTMSEVRSYTTAGDRIWMLMFTTLGAQALLMTAIGLYGLLAFAVVQRRREIGVRVALGARPAAVVRLVVGKAMSLTAAGLAIGLGGAVLVTRALVSGLYGVSGTLTPLAAVFVILTVTALVAAFLPARRAAQVDPMVALRSE